MCFLNCEIYSTMNHPKFRSNIKSPKIEVFLINDDEENVSNKGSSSSNSSTGSTDNQRSPLHRIHLNENETESNENFSKNDYQRSSSSFSFSKFDFSKIQTPTEKLKQVDVQEFNPFLMDSELWLQSFEKNMKKILNREMLSFVCRYLDEFGLEFYRKTIGQNSIIEWPEFKNKFIHYFKIFRIQKTKEALSMSYKDGDMQVYMEKKLKLLKYVFPKASEDDLMRMAVVSVDTDNETESTSEQQNDPNKINSDTITSSKPTISSKDSSKNEIIRKESNTSSIVEQNEWLPLYDYNQNSVNEEANNLDDSIVNSSSSSFLSKFPDKGENRSIKKQDDHLNMSNKRQTSTDPRLENKRQAPTDPRLENKRQLNHTVSVKSDQTQNSTKKFKNLIEPNAQSSINDQHNSLNDNRSLKKNQQLDILSRTNKDETQENAKKSKNNISLSKPVDSDAKSFETKEHVEKTIDNLSITDWLSNNFEEGNSRDGISKKEISLDFTKHFGVPPSNTTKFQIFRACYHLFSAQVIVSGSQKTDDQKLQFMKRRISKNNPN